MSRTLNNINVSSRLRFPECNDTDDVSCMYPLPAGRQIPENRIHYSHRREHLKSWASSLRVYFYRFLTKFNQTLTALFFCTQQTSLLETQINISYLHSMHLHISSHT